VHSFRLRIRSEYFGLGGFSAVVREHWLPSLLTDKVGTVSMKVQLIVVRGKPEGKVIPLVGSTFKIGRGETCHLRPNSEQVSREHAEFTISGDVVSVGDLGSRNGTLVNGKALTTGPCQLKDRDLVQVGPLTFAVSIQKTPAAATTKPAPAASPAKPAAPSPAAPPAAPQAQAKGKAAPEDVSNDEIDSWLFGEGTGTSPDQPTSVYGGDTITITAFKDAAETPAAPAKPPSAASDDEYERQEEEEEEKDDEEVEFDEADDQDADDEEEDAEEEAPPEDEFMDESNPFYAAKKAQKEQAQGGGKQGPGANQQFKDTSDAATEILRKLMEKRRASK
jgi:pSer/pThr/pTyr-binding forkhead associated (FHA) protein